MEERTKKIKKGEKDMTEYQEKVFSEIIDEKADFKTFCIVEAKLEEMIKQRDKSIVETTALNGAITILKSMIKQY